MKPSSSRLQQATPPPPGYVPLLKSIRDSRATAANAPLVRLWRAKKTTARLPLLKPPWKPQARAVASSFPRHPAASVRWTMAIAASTSSNWISLEPRTVSDTFGEP